MFIASNASCCAACCYGSMVAGHLKHHPMPEATKPPKPISFKNLSSVRFIGLEILGPQNARSGVVRGPRLPEGPLNWKDNHIPTQNLYYNYYYPNPKYLIIGSMDPKP